MKIKVTRKHIRKGKRGLSFRCPVALALKEKTKVEWMVGLRYANSRVKLFDLPPVAVDFIRDFDDGKRVEPFSFELE